MPHLSPQTLTEAEQRRLRRATASHLRDHLIFSMALCTALRLAEIVGLGIGTTASSMVLPAATRLDLPWTSGCIQE